jgi:DNA-binding IclR family transcriptional regulator
MSSAKRQSSTLFVGSVAKAFLVLEAFSSERRSLNLGEISSHTGLDKSAAQRFANTLHVLGYLHKDPVTRRYLLSPKALEIGLNYLRISGLAETAAPFLREAARQCDETVNLTQLDGRDIVYVNRIPSRHIISVDVLVGSRFPAWCTAAGRVLLAYLPEDAMRSVLKDSDRMAYTAKTTTGVEALVAIVKQARERGYSFAAEQMFLGEYTIAAPIFNLAHEPIAALSISGLASRHSREAFESKMLPIVLDTAGAISSTQGMHHPRRAVPVRRRR